jgi:ethanolamine ammonia-lyase large subunit
MSNYKYTLGNRTYTFKNLADLMAKATPKRSGDLLAGVSALSSQERVIAQMRLAEVPLKTFLTEALIPYENDEITRLIIDEHDIEAFEAISHLTVGDFRNWLLSDSTTVELIKQVRDGITPEMAAAVSKIMRNQDLIMVEKNVQ